MTDAIRTDGLVKAFGRTRALDGLDLTVATGEVHGFLGPNGAGKTTTIRVLLGLLRADAGTARLLGGDPWADATTLHRRLAYVPGDVTLWPSLSGGEVIDLLGRLRGGLDTRRRAELLERFDLDPRKKGRAYSTGNRQKVALVAALASDVELLLLDEPTAGLDPLMEEAFRQVTREEQRRGDRTVLLSSHILAEVEALCDRLTIIPDGRAVETGTLADLRHLTRTSIQAELPADRRGWPTCPACTTCAGRTAGSASTSTPTRWTRRCGSSPAWACAAWSASRPPWRSCSCATTSRARTARRPRGVAMNALTGTGKLVRLILRRDRVLLPLWVPFIAVVPLSYVASINALFPTAAGRPPACPPPPRTPPPWTRP
jgi:ABC-2 type transport system ATP-binding protein